MSRTTVIFHRAILLLALFAVGYGWHMVLHYTVPLWARFPLTLAGDTALLTGYWFLVKPAAQLFEGAVVGGILIVLVISLAFVKAHWFNYNLSYKTVYSAVVAGCAPFIAGGIYTLFNRRTGKATPSVR